MNDFARDNELKTRGNRVGLWSLVKTSVLDQKRMCVCALQNVMSALPPIATAKADMRKWSCPLCPQKRTCALQLRMSAMGQKRTSGVRVPAPSLLGRPPNNPPATECQKGKSEPYVDGRGD